MGEMTAGGTLDRRRVVEALLRDRGDDLLVVTGLGSPAYDVMAAGDHDLNYYLWAAMGSAATIGLGIAKACPGRRVLVITGDGEMLMGMGALATIALQKPANLSIVVIDNGHYGETGMQASHAGQGVELADVARACGFNQVAVVHDDDGVEALRQRIHREGLNFASVKVDLQEHPRVLPPRDGVHVKNRFRAALGFAPN